MRAFSAGVILTLAATRVVPAQTDAGIQLGGAQMRFGDSASVRAAVASSSLEMSSTTLALGLGGNVSSFDSRSWTANGRVDASAFSLPFSFARGELHAYGDGTRSGNADATYSVGAGARLHIGGDRGGVWVGSTAGTASDGARSTAIRAVDAGAWFRASAVSGHFTFSPTRLGSRVRYDDVDGSLRLEGMRFDGTVAAGARRLENGRSTAWAQASAVYWVHPRVGLALGGGRFAADVAQGYPAGSYVSGSVRWALARRPNKVSPAGFGAAPSRDATDAFELVPRPEGRHTFVIQVAARDSVEVMGDFTDWLPVLLSKRADGRWEGTFAISPGVHELNVRADGGSWTVPRGMASRSNDLGETVAILVVPENSM